MAIQVRPDMSVEVLAPIKAELESVYEMVKKRAGWILKKLSLFKDFPAKTAPKLYMEGEHYFYLGNMYNLKIELSIKSEVKIIDHFIVVKAHYPSNKSLIKQMIDGWYLAQARELFQQMTEAATKRFPKPSLMKPKETIIKTLKRKWGSMSTRGTMTLNLRLIHAPLECIDYVIIHELCHIIHHNHSKDFWGLVAQVMPDWKEHKKKLDLVP